MSEVQEEARVEADPSAAQPTQLTAGAMLRRAREAAGLHVAALAVSLKVPVRKLEALEEDRYDVLTDAVFVRALASSVCRTLKLDAQTVLDRLPQTAAPRLLRHTEGLNQPFRAPGDGAPPTWLEQMGQPVFLAVFALLLGALVLIFLPKAQQSDAPAAAAKLQAPETPAPPIQPVAIPVTPGQVVTNVVSQPAAAASAAPPATLLPVAAPAKAPAVMVPAQPPKTAASASRVSEAPAPSEPAALPAGILVFRTKAPSWVEVTDAQGAVAVRKVLSAGEEASASGALPLQVTVGRVDSTEVQLRGKPFDLRPVSRDNVARFEVK